MLLFLLMVASAPVQADTTVPVPAGARLEMNLVDGGVRVTTWAKSTVRVVTSGGKDADLKVQVSGRRVTVEAQDPDGGPYDGDLEISVPVDLALSISTVSGDIAVTGSRADLDLESVEGNVTVEGGSGVVTLHSVSGDVRVTGAKGKIELNTVDGSISGRGLDGEVSAETVDGEVTLAEVTGTGVEATTVDGNVRLEAVLKAGGRYRLNSHDGDVTLSVPALDAAVTISTFSGSFESAFPVTLNSTRGGKRMNFTVGAGAASVDLESFDGDIRIEKRGAVSR
jgi:DUF4097 and DUF4098 domain-containing protein YvlB